MDIRKSAATLPDVERDAFLEAILKLKQRPAPNSQQAISVYDQFVALHGAVMAVVAPGAVDPINFAHGNIGFLPWHRQYIRALELALRVEVPGVTLPYWDWSDDVGAAASLFTPGFLSSTTWGAPAPIADGLLRFRVPSNERPSWWPAGLRGFEVDANLEEGNSRSLSRGGQEPDWPPSAADLNRLAALTISIRGANPLWPFWLVLEAGHGQISRRTHNAAHRFIGGHMSGAFSPNDPVFWMHHANVDRLWAQWQGHQLNQNPGSTRPDHWPDPGDLSPFDGRPAPTGHRLNDEMWPWVGSAAGYSTVSASQAVRNRLPNYTSDPAVTVGDVLDNAAMGYDYQ